MHLLAQFLKAINDLVELTINHLDCLSFWTDKRHMTVHVFI